MIRYLANVCDCALKNVYLEFHLFSMNITATLLKSKQFNNRNCLPHSHFYQFQNKHYCHLNDLVLCFYLFFFFNSMHLKEIEKNHWTWFDVWWHGGFYILIFNRAIWKCSGWRFVSILRIKTKLALLVNFFVYFFRFKVSALAFV